MIQKLTYPGILPEEDLLGRALGPDLHGGWLEVTAVTYANRPGTIGLKNAITQATVKPGSPEKGKYLLDAYGQAWTRDFLANKSWFHG